ncbi:hypothetical protein GCM10023332_04410 [Luteimonas vadosa]|uniref:Uncharacterized protein n=1 Tax=Luteimonas vadosa TaxID=1165507 RepID=A0ABP9DRT6_9GAMM
MGDSDCNDGKRNALDQDWREYSEAVIDATCPGTPISRDSTPAVRLAPDASKRIARIGTSWIDHRKRLSGDRDALHAVAVAGAACVPSAGLVHGGNFVHVSPIACGVARVRAGIQRPVRSRSEGSVGSDSTRSIAAQRAASLSPAPST